MSTEHTRGRRRQAGGAIAILFAFSIGLQFSTASLGSVDGYFHARYSQLIWQGGLRGFPPAFPWLPLTIRSADRYFDHHMLFHLLMAPFVARDPVLGAKWASAAFAALAFVAVYASLFRRGVRHVEWWLVAVFALAPDFLFRMEMPRVQALSVVCLLLGLEALLARGYVWLLPLAVIYTWLYDAFPMLLVMAGLFVSAVVIRERRIEWRALAYPALGMVIGLVANPYFPNDIWFILQHYLGKTVIAGDMHFGSEWYPYPVAQWLGWPGAVATLAVAAMFTWRARRRLDVTRLALLLIGTMYFVLVWRSRRFIEYAGPFVGLALAASLHEWIDTRVSLMPKFGRRVFAALILLGLTASSAFAVYQLRRRTPPQQFAGGARWLAEHTPPGAIVFTADWDSFPLLFFHNQRNRYVIGLDPTYLALQNAELYQTWRALGRGELQPPSTYLSRFDARVVFTDHAHGDFNRVLDADPVMTRVYEDAECLIFARRDD